ncbi:MAG: acylneuraminate cytidylyltransferase family protein [Helicobacter sp.]|uniref:acylneuraminate cytidylyltransferase family protein n=1 Tax=Helicobacter sp. TaxID=218 RepID=UPI002A917B71|nr:acylneuraminate cytidylyltransferase family protein [Helicobacter sp.]MDY5821619.1 acylneuraminate cytidylyltransferase family protein [Helicobacter sp.]
MNLALIPARAGSKSIKNKNLAMLCEKPLLYYTIESAKKAQCIDKIVVSSDGDLILQYALSQGVETLNRPEEIARDSTTSDEVILHAIKHYKDLDNIILLQPTSPLRDSNDIDKAYRIFKEKNANALISVTQIDNKILKAFIAKEDGSLQGIHNNTYPFMPRQSLPQTYQSNGAIYIVKRDLFIENPSFLPQNTHYYLMSEEHSIDIDTLADLEYANKIMQNKTL